MVRDVLDLNGHDHRRAHLWTPVPPREKIAKPTHYMLIASIGVSMITHGASSTDVLFFTLAIVCEVL